MSMHTCVVQLGFFDKLIRDLQMCGWYVKPKKEALASPKLAPKEN